MDVPVRREIRIQGVVQGVGFRPFVHALATGLGLAGFVTNDESGVRIEVEGPPRCVERFVADVVAQRPPLSIVDSLTCSELRPLADTSFVIAPSSANGPRRTLVSADIATCDDCLRELFDAADRRFGYPFINCTNCGPRFTIVRDVPYDRAATTMHGFAMCVECQAEYDDPADRRFHAQPVCCPACGPQLRVLGADGAVRSDDPLSATVRLLAEGAVVAIKGLGGYHLAAVAADEAAVSALRARKHREDKPFALMAPDVAGAARLCRLDPAAIRALTSGARPIALAPRRPDAPVAAAVAPGSRELGVMLPYTPLHHLLVRELGRPLVLTSGNVSDEPIAYRDEDARHRLSPIADAFLLHDRPIHVRTDDSVVRITGGRERTLRRSRGFAPAPLSLPWPFPRHVLACGAERKNTFCVARDRHAFISHHIGDLENAETLGAFVEGIDHFQRLFDIAPAVVAHDLHPEYLSTKHALEISDVELVGVQHHHAHIASCLADNGEAGPVIGVAFDGLGYGTDGTLWGGEFLAAGLTGFRRVGRLAPVAMPGGTAAIRQPWRMAAAYLDLLFGDGSARHDVARRHAERWDDVRRLIAGAVRTPMTSSAGRLFDAVAAVLGVRDQVSYEGQAAIELEQCADPDAGGSYRATIRDGEPFEVLGSDLVAAAVDDYLAAVPVPTIAMRFHRGVAHAIVTGCERVRTETNLSCVALSGGVFQNSLLLGIVVPALAARRFRVLTHARVPTNDGGISLGQATIVAAIERSSG